MSNVECSIYPLLCIPHHHSMKLRVLFLIFLSGFASLVYQILWMKQLGLLFGNTAYAAAATYNFMRLVKLTAT